jgi:hypothetical protein
LFSGRTCCLRLSGIQTSRRRAKDRAQAPERVSGQYARRHGRIYRVAAKPQTRLDLPLRQYKLCKIRLTSIS